MPKVDFFRAYKNAINAIRSLPQIIPIITTEQGLQVWINRCDPTLSFKDVSYRNGKTIRAGSIQIDVLVCFNVGGVVATMNINPLVTNTGCVDINQFRIEYLRIIGSEAFPKELKARLNGSPRLLYDIFNAYMSVTRMIVEAVDFECPFNNTQSAYA